MEAAVLALHGQNYGGVVKCIWVVFASNLHAEMVKTTVRSSRSNILGFVQFWEVLLPALRGEPIFEKGTQNENLTIIFDFQCPKCVFVANHL